MTNVFVGRKALEGHLDFHTAPVLSYVDIDVDRFYILTALTCDFT